MIIKQGNRIVLFFLIIWSIVSCTPILGNPTYFVALLSVAIVMLIANNSLFKHQQFLVFGALSYITLSLFYKIVGYSSAEWGNYMNQLLFFVPILLMLLMQDRLNVRQKRLLCLIMLLVMFVNIADNIRLSILYPELNSVGRLYQDADFLSSINVGGTTFYTFTLFVFNICFFIYLNCKEKKIRYIVLVIAIVSSIYILVFSLRGSIVVYFLLSIILQYFAFKTRNTTLFLFILIFAGIITFITVVLFQDVIIDFIISISPNERLTTRLVTLVDVENEEANLYTITGRTNLYLLSVHTWLSDITNFFFGIGDHRAAQGAITTGIGQHADLLDTLARYGLLGLVLIFLTFKYYFEFLISLFEKKYKQQLLTIFTILIMCGVTKGIFAAGVGCVIFLLLPLSSAFVNENK